MASNTLNTESSIFLSRSLEQAQGEDMIEKQNAEQGLMPIVSDESMTYGYTSENQQVSAAFLRGEQPLESLKNGVVVVELLMAAYLSAQLGKTVKFPVDLEDFVPDVAQGTWKP